MFRIGQRPPRSELFAGDLTDDTSNWNGSARTIEELDLLRERITKAVEEIGGKVPNLD